MTFFGVAYSAPLRSCLRNFPKKLQSLGAEWVDCFVSWNWSVRAKGRSLHLDSCVSFQEAEMWRAPKVRPVVQTIWYLIKGISMEIEEKQ